MSALGHHQQKHASTALSTAHPGSIKPLPEAVVAQIKSSTTIVSLIDAVLGLLKNALDARASKVDVTVDFLRGGCTVEDNGFGIAPSGFREEGGLGKRYCTSKYCSEAACYGRNGTFLASLGAMSLLTIASRHHEHRSENLLTLHQAKVIRRETPLASQHEIQGNHGTRVTVRNLFGDLPVRVKRRGMAAGQKEHGRLWEALKRETTNLMLSWLEPVSVKIRDGDGRTPISLSTVDSVGCETNPRLSALNSMLNVLTQANLLRHDAWGSWIPVSASTSIISVKGAISLDPAPSKRVQFISLGIFPLSADSGHNELFDDINRIFASSSFGAMENDADGDDDETRQLQCQRDRRPKNDSHSNRQPKARKGVDRYPMFHFRLSLSHGDKRDADRDECLFDQDRVTLSLVVETLKALVIEWLDVHHFRSPRSRICRSISGSHTPNSSETSAPSGKPHLGIRQMPNSFVTSAPLANKLRDVNNRKRKMAKAPLLGEESNRKPRLAFSDWSRTKSGCASSQNNMHRKENSDPLTRSVTCTPLAASDSHIPLGTKLDVPLVSRGSLGAGLQSGDSAQDDLSVKDDSFDGAFSWTDTTTKRTFFLNARTGCVIPSSRGVPVTHCSTNDEGNVRKLYERPARSFLNTASYSNNTDTWLSDVLGNWENPVFKPNEASIQQITSYEDQAGHECDRSKYFCEKAKSVPGHSPTFPILNMSKLSKAGLREAEVIAQVDRKFILAKMQQSSENLLGSGNGGDILVLIDQHAADERIRVETLLAELCAPNPDGAGSYRSELGHHSPVIFVMLDKPIQFHLSTEEQEQFTTHAAAFAAWGILFDIVTRPSHLSRPHLILSVTTLPPAVSERCKAAPQVLITFLRAAVWKYAADPILPPVPDEAKTGAPAWVRRISSCPEGLVDLINSRACRSAVMFNDKLDLEECRRLVQKLCECVFPFVCAHGRPSMVPLVAVAQDDKSNSGKVTNESMDLDQSFIGAWKRWQKK